MEIVKLTVSYFDLINNLTMFDVKVCTKPANVVVLKEAGVPMEMVHLVQKLVDAYSSKCFHEFNFCHGEQANEQVARYLEYDAHLYCTEEDMIGYKAIVNALLSVVSNCGYNTYAGKYLNRVCEYYGFSKAFYE